MAAAKEFLIDALVAAATITGSQMGTDNEAVMIHLLLPLCRLMAVEAVDPFAGVGTHLVFMDNGILRSSVTLGAFA